METLVRLAQASDLHELARLLAALWPESAVEEHARELELILAGKAPGTLPLVIFVAEDEDRSLVGFLECAVCVLTPTAATHLTPSDTSKVGT